MDGEDEIAILRRQLAAAEAGRAAAEASRAAAEASREAAEARAKVAEPLTLEEYLEACHSVLPIQVERDRALTTQGPTTDPVGRLTPRRIIPWREFPDLQEETWAVLSQGTSFSSDAIFPSSHQLEYVRSMTILVSGEQELRHYLREAVENAVYKLVSAVSKYELLRASLALKGIVTFQSHLNLGQPAVDPAPESLGLPSGDSLLSDPTGVLTPAQATEPQRKARGRGGPADQFCIYRTSHGQNIPTVAIEYKPPHKLTVAEVVTGLKSEIQPERDVINKDGEDFEFTSKTLAAAVITQLFSYMIGKGMQYGYVCTGETYVFLYIPDDPTIVYYYVCVPSQDVQDDDDGRLRRTAVAQVFAFTLRALRKKPPTQLWYDRAANLNTWAVEYDDILSKIPSSKRNSPFATPYKPERWRPFQRSPIKTRSSCNQPENQTRHDHDDEADNNGDSDDSGDSSPTPNFTWPSGQTTTASRSWGRQQGQSKRQRRRGGRDYQGQQIQRIQDRPFCTHKCLRGLAYGGAMDKNCPNFHDHGGKHISQLRFLHLIRAQLALDRGPEADCVPLYLRGARGALFKLRLSSHGYTLVAKGVEMQNFRRLRYEKKLYDRLRPVQGRYVPVCVGMIDLALPYYYDGGVYEYLLFMGWAGRPLFKCINHANKAQLVTMTTRAFNAIHQLQVLQRDAELRNILYDEQKDSLMIIDFERAEYTNSQDQKRKLEKKQRAQGEVQDDFERELRWAIHAVSRYSIRGQ